MIKAIGEKIRESTNIAIMAHVNEDGDALGSVFALYESLKGIGKKAVCFLDSKPENRLQFLCGEYKLITDALDTVFDLCFALDCADKLRLGERAEIFDRAKFTVCIDHHVTNAGYADINVIKPDASSTAEVLFQVLRECEIPLSTNAAKCLYAGISSDSGCFKYSSTSPNTMRIAAELLEYDFDHADVMRLLFDTERLENIKLKGYIMNNIESFFDGKLQMVVTDKELLEKFGVSEKDASDLVNIPRSVEGCEIAAELKKRNGQIRLSLRSYHIDMSEIAKQFGGGGHKLAAGATIDVETMEKAKELVIKACERKLGEIK